MSPSSFQSIWSLGTCSSCPGFGGLTVISQKWEASTLQCCSCWGFIVYKAVFRVSLYHQRDTVIFIPVFAEKKRHRKLSLLPSHTNSKCQSRHHPWHLFSLSEVGVSVSNRNFVPGQLLAVNQIHHKDSVSSCRWL